MSDIQELKQWIQRTPKTAPSKGSSATHINLKQAGELLTKKTGVLSRVGGPISKQIMKHYIGGITPIPQKVLNYIRRES